MNNKIKSILIFLGVLVISAVIINILNSLIFTSGICGCTYGEFTPTFGFVIASCECYKLFGIFQLQPELYVPIKLFTIFINFILPFAIAIIIIAKINKKSIRNTNKK